MDSKDEKCVLLEKNKQQTLRSEKVGDKVEFASLKYVPLEIRRREAKKPMFLTRYE